MPRLRHLNLLSGLLAAASLSVGAQTRPRTEKPNVVVVSVAGAGYPYEVSPENRPNLKRLRQSSRIFDAAFASTPGGGALTEALFFGFRGPRKDATLAGRASLVSGARNVGYQTVRVGITNDTDADRALPYDRSLTLDAPRAAREAARMIETATSPAFVHLSLDLSSPAPRALAVEPPVGVPFEGPAIAIADRTPLDAPGEITRVAAPGPDVRRREADIRLGTFHTLDAILEPLLAAMNRTAGGGRKTILVLATSGGAPRSGRPAMGRSDLLFEDALRSFVLIRTPDLIDPGAASPALVDLADVGVTLAELIGAPLDGARDGRSLAAILQDARAPGPRDTLITSVDREPPLIGRSVRNATHRYTLWPDGSEELYDAVADPREWTNLATSPALSITKAQLRSAALGPAEPLPVAPARGGASGRPNVLLIIGDDYGSHIEKFARPITPNLDRLRARGRVFTRAFAPAPTCVPSRAAFLSGLSPLRLELQRNNPWEDVFARVPLIQEHFRSAGYFTAAVGKVWDSEPGASRGFDLNVWTPALPPGAVERGPAKGEGDILSWGGPTENDDAVEADGRRARLAASLLAESRDRPFFISLGLIRPHMEWIAPRRYFDLYAREPIRFETAPEGDGADIPAIAIRNRPQELPGLFLRGREPAGFINDPARGVEGVRMYLAALSFMDAQVGVALDALEEAGRTRDTIVVFLGDNGHHFGDHGGLWRKDTLFEDALRVPLVIAGPGVGAPGQATDALVDLLDLFPTLVDLTGVSRPGHLDGRSLASILRDPAARVHETVRQFRAAASPWRAFSIRTPTHRYTLWPDGSEELYSVASDPAGFTNLATRSATIALRQSLRASIERSVPRLR
jgi:arylsulfatase A-like enzyme